jgi:hypothetical protein
MATVTIERSGPAIRAAPTRYSHEDEPRFAAELAQLWPAPAMTSSSLARRPS